MSSLKAFNRRDFLKVIGAGTGLAASGCASDLPEKLIPYVVQPDEVVPGNAVWYTGTCNECSAGCGVLVRTREGRALKVEGNPRHPVNKGGLCALGQSSVQSLYDPDRIREPLVRAPGESFKPASWRQAIDQLAEGISAAAEKGKKVVFITRPLQPTERSLLSRVLNSAKTKSNVVVEHLEYELLSDDALVRAAESLYGKKNRSYFQFDKADVIVSFGADYLETWVSPVQFTKGYSARRTPERAVASNGKGISKVYQIEPRLSLTAANSDVWLKNAPRTEVSLLKALISEVARKKSLSPSQRSAADFILKDFDLSQALSGSTVNPSLFTEMVASLLAAKTSLVVAGGATVSADADEAALLALFLNEILGNVGNSVLIGKFSGVRGTEDGTPLVSLQATPERLKVLMAELEASKVGTVVVLDTNPVFTLPGNSGFAKSLGKADLVVSISRSLDETTKIANQVLALSTSFESWGDSEPLPGIFALNQPAMQALYQSQSFGDILLSLDASPKFKAGGTLKDYSNYLDVIKESWKNSFGGNDSASQFDKKWQKLVEEGGDWSRKPVYQSSPVANLDANSWSFNKFSASSKKHAAPGLSAIAFPTVRFHDGKGSNRPWMQEIPDPMTTSVWGSWVELHPDTAARYGLSNGQVVQIKSAAGAVEAPIYFSKQIHPSAIAIPIGQGHDGYGRFASGVGVSPLELMDMGSSSSVVPLIIEAVELRPSVARDKIVALQFSDKQLDRGFIRSVTEKEFNTPKDDHHGGHGGHHNALALGPREEPKQMYKQMEHPLYRWGMSIDLSSCTGCSACVAACYAENNISVVGKQLCEQGREMSWLRVARYFDGPEEHPVTGFGPMMCQHCGNAPCEPVCPVYATYHAEDGLNTMVYNRCVGTRYCANNCSYKVRRFNWFNFEWPEPLQWQLNPDVTVRSVGVMEKCSFCIQRIREGQNVAKDEGREIRDGEVVPACASSCPTDAIVFGNLQDPESKVAKLSKSARGYKVLDFELNTQPAITYLAKVTHQDIGGKKDHHSDDHGGDHGSNKGGAAKGAGHAGDGHDSHGH